MGRRKAAIEFTPNPENPEHQILHRYLSSLESSISKSIMQAVKEKFLLSAMIADGSSQSAIQVTGIELTAKQNAQIEINRRILATQNLVSPSPDLPKFSPQVSVNTSFASTDEDDDSWDDERIPSNNMVFRGEHD